GLDALGDSHRRRRRGDAEQVMPASLAVTRPTLAGLAEWDRFLGQLRQGVVLAEDADDRLPRAERGREGGRNLGDPALDLEAGLLQGVGEQGRRLLLQVAGLGELPDLLG